MKRRFCAENGLVALSVLGEYLEAKDGVIEVDDAKCPPELLAELEEKAANGAGGLYESEPETKKEKK